MSYMLLIAMFLQTRVVTVHTFQPGTDMPCPTVTGQAIPPQGKACAVRPGEPLARPYVTLLDGTNMDYDAWRAAGRPSKSSNN